MTAADWMDVGACVGIDPAVMVPTDQAGLERATRLCAGCPVKAECLQHALEHGEQFGVWGGTTPDERRAIRRRLRDAS